MPKGRNASSTSRIVALAAAALTASISVVPSAGAGGLALVHAEDFSTSSSLDTAFWSVETGLFRNHEAQSYALGNVKLAKGLLVIKARRASAQNAAYRPRARYWPADVRSADYTSGSIVSRKALTFGAIEVVARLPRGAGTWPAIWLISEQGTPYREIDIVEAVGSTPGLAFSTVSAGPDLARVKNWRAETAIPTLAAAFHTYRLEWCPNAITVSIDDRPVLRMDPEDARPGSFDPLQAAMHLRINLALGGSWGGRIDDSALPASLEIKSVRVWRLDGSCPAGPSEVEDRVAE